MLLAAIAFLFGTFIGSFLNVCIHRLPRNESVVHPPSRCYACGTQVQWYDNLPVISWLVLWGRCRWCGTAFSPRYLIVELAVGALTAATVWMAFGIGGWSAPWLTALGVGGQIPPAAAAGALLLLVWFLFVASVIDLDHFIIPDELTKPMQVVAPFLGALVGTNLAFAWTPGEWMTSVTVMGEVVPTPGRFIGWFIAISAAALALLALSLPLARSIYRGLGWKEADHRGFRIGVWWFIVATIPAVAVVAISAAVSGHGPGIGAGYAVSLAQAVLGALAGWWSIYLVGLVGTVAFRKNAMGFGDAKFLAPVGAFLGPVGIVYTFFAASVLGTVVGLPAYLLTGRNVIPFGPYLAGGAVLTLLAGPWVHARVFG